MNMQRAGAFTYWINFVGENDDGREYELRCRIYADNGQKETRWTPGYDIEVFVEEIYLYRNHKSLYLPQKHRFYDRCDDIVQQFYDEMECRAFDCPIMD